MHRIFKKNLTYGQNKTGTPQKTALFPIPRIVNISSGPQLLFLQELVDAIKHFIFDCDKNTTFLEAPIQKQKIRVFFKDSAKNLLIICQFKTII